MNLKMRLAVAIFIALVLTILPMPVLFHGCKPAYLLLVVFYLQFYLPKYFNLIFIYFLSFLLDVLLATIIGEHALALFLTTWFAADRTRRFVFFPISQQILMIFLLSTIYQLTIFMIDSFLGNNYQFINLIGNVFLTTLLWPWFKILADSFFHTLPLSRR